MDVKLVIKQTQVSSIVEEKHSVSLASIALKWTSGHVTNRRQWIKLVGNVLTVDMISISELWNFITLTRRRKSQIGIIFGR
jgi:hypothetical protein